IVQWEWAFGDTTISTLQNPVYVYQSSGFYDVKLRVTDSIGCTDSISVPDIVYATQPIPDFLISPEINCTDKSAVFLNLSTGSGLSYFWDFGDGDDSNLANVNHAYQDTGVYDVTLTVTDVNGCDSTLHIPKAVWIREVVAQFTVDTTNASCPPLTVNFEADTALPHDGLTYTWDLGNGASSSQPISSITYSLPGVYDVRLIVSSETGCSDTLVMEDLIVVEGTSAQFGFTPQEGCPGTEVSFTAQSNLPVSYEWLFGDGSADLGTTAQHTYHTPGSYTPVLVVEDTTGCKVFQISDSTIDIFEAPTAYFSIMDTLGCDSLAAHLIQQSTGGVPLTQWNWYVDGVLTDSGSDPTIALDQLGVYDLSLIVSDIRGCRDTLERLSAVKVVPSPTPQIIIGDSVGCIPFSTQAAVWVPSHTSPLLQPQWTLDSNQAGQGSPHTIDVTTSGMQDLVVQVTDINGCVGTAKKSIEALAPPYPDFAADLRFTCAPASVQFTDFSTGGNGIATWSWDLGNGTSSQDQDPLIHYPQDGIFDVQLRITGVNGCSDSIRHQAYIQLQHPHANFAIPTGDRCPNNEILFENLSSSDTSLTSFQWTWGDGNSSDLEAPIHQYSTPGTYLPSLWVEDAKGCRDTFATTEPILIVKDVEPEQIQVRSVSVSSPHSIVLTFEPFDNIRGDFARYIIFRENEQGSFEPIASLRDPEIGIFTDMLAQEVDAGAPHCYRIIVENLCGTRALLDQSEIHCTIDLSTQAATERVEVSWTHYVGWSRVEQYFLYRTILGSSSGEQLIATLPGDITTYTDTDMYCYDQYEYKVMALGGRGLSSQSDSAQAIPDHLPPTIPHHMGRVSVENGDFLVVEWDELILTQGESIVVERDAGNGYQSIFRQPYDRSNFKYQDMEADVQEKSYAYRVFGIDSCGDKTPVGRIGKSILLETQTNGRINTLIWTPYEGWPQGVSAYRVEIYDESSNQYQVLARLKGDQTQYTDQAFERKQIQNCYRIVAEAEYRENYESTSNEVCSLQKPKLTAPNAFTPNGDGQNDVFTLEGLFLGEGEMQIFNRWGILVYRTQSLELSWDGYARSGGPSPEGVYTFVVTGTGIDGTRLKRTGTVHLIR
ncbi:MAG: PKD domain-containing protein, partial [Bacteroidota bacterium]